MQENTRPKTMPGRRVAQEDRASWCGPAERTGGDVFPGDILRCASAVKPEFNAHLPRACFFHKTGMSAPNTMERDIESSPLTSIQGARNGRARAADGRGTQGQPEQPAPHVAAAVRVQREAERGDEGAGVE